MPNEYNNIIIHPDFKRTIIDLAKKVHKLPKPVFAAYDSDGFAYPVSPKLEVLGQIQKVKMDAQKGRDFFDKQEIYAYDESFGTFNALEGTAFLCSHSLVYVKEKYLPVNKITLYFYTKSKSIKGDSTTIRYSDDQELDSKKDYYKDRIDLFREYVHDNSILLIDGPLIAGNAYVLFIQEIEKLLDRDVCTIFFVKNSGGNVVTDNVPELKGIYNCDLHWASQYLELGERTNLFKYTDLDNKENSRVFCFIKAYNASPQRVEFHSATYEKYKSIINDALDMIYYLLLVQGKVENPQVRPIAIAEMYARETLKLFDINKELRDAGIMATMNQVRFG
jgi:hypothetical protein